MMKYINSVLLMVAIAIMPSAVEPHDNHCCPHEQILYARTEGCWEPKSNKTTPILLTCKDTIRTRLNFSINAAGQMEVIFNEDSVIKADPGRYCLANVTLMSDVNLTKLRWITVLCVDEEEEKIVDDEVLGYCSIVSVVFLALTAFIYMALPELRDLQGKSIVHFSGSLGIGLAILSMMKLMEYTNMSLCAARGFLAYFFLIASFFWTNAISIQVLRSTRRPSIGDYGWKEFGWYALYAWGCSTVLTISMAIVNYYPGKHRKPGIGLNHCWFFDGTQQWYYMYSVLAILLTANISIFIYTSTIIWRLSFSSSHVKAVKFKLVMTVRLIILMGLPWVFEMVSSLSPVHIIWTITDIFNTLQGLLIFLLLVVFRRRTVKAMYRHGWLDCVSGLVEKWLAGNDDEENVVQHTDVPMVERNDNGSLPQK